MFPLFFGFDPTFIVLIPAILFTFYAKLKVDSTFNKYLGVEASSRRTGAQVARDLLDQNHLYDVPVELTPGTLSDHYDPRRRVLRLSPEVYHGRSLASLGVAAHETGHAVQHSQAYFPLVLRNTIVPIANIGTNLGWYLFLFGLIFNSNMLMIDLGILLFSFSVLFTLVTLPVEFNASSRAMDMLVASGYVAQGQEESGTKKVLNAAALTYLAAAAMAIFQLLRMLLIRGRRND